MPKFDENYDLKLHRDDHWLDEVRLIHQDTPALRLILMYRYKTSGLSGDEWRVSSGWQIHHSLADKIIGDCEPFLRDSNWFNFDTGYGHKLDAGCAALFPGIHGNQPHLCDIPISSIDFMRKGRLLYRSTHDGHDLRLALCAGHLPWALIMANDAPLGTDTAWADMKRLCFQPGCSETAVSTFELKCYYDKNGDKKMAVERRYELRAASYDVKLVRRFCPLHLQRGDCGLEDADDNYIVIDGPGPSEAIGWEEYESQSSFGGII